MANDVIVTPYVIYEGWNEIAAADYYWLILLELLFYVIALHTFPFGSKCSIAIQFSCLWSGGSELKAEAGVGWFHAMDQGHEVPPFHKNQVRKYGLWLVDVKSLFQKPHTRCTITAKLHSACW